MDHEINIKFLGIANRSRFYERSTDILGLSNLIGLPFLPQCLKSLHAVFAIEPTKHPSHFKLKITYTDVDNPNVQGFHNIDLALDPSIPPQNSENTYTEEEVTGFRSNLGMQILALNLPPIVVTQPGIFRVEAACNEGASKWIGTFQVAATNIAPLSQSEIDAIKSDPNAVNAIKLSVGCKFCDDKIELHKTIDNQLTLFSKNGKPLANQGLAVWVCGCSKTKISLSYARDGLHQIFRQPRGWFDTQDIDYVKLYRDRAIDDVLRAFDLLIVSSPAEEEVQNFLESNKLFWGFLSPSQILLKPKILTHFVADFAILSSNNILYFIEIEKPQTKITKKNGGMHSELQAGLDQIRDWKIVVDDHRQAVLDCIKIDRQKIHTIKYLLVAGLSYNANQSGLQAIRRSDSSCVHMCFDELSNYVKATQSIFSSL